MNQSVTATNRPSQLRRASHDLFIRFSDELDPEAIARWIQDHLPQGEPVDGCCESTAAGGEDDEPGASKPLSERWPQARWLRFPDSATVDEVLTSDLNQAQGIERLSPVCVRCEESDDADVGLIATGDVLALRSPEISLAAMEHALEPLRDWVELLDAPWAEGPAEPLMLLRVNGEHPEDVFERVHELNELALEGRDGRSVGVFEFVEADLIQLHDAFCNTPFDAVKKMCAAADSWHLEQINQKDALSVLPNPLPEVLVGVIDSGCDLGNQLLVSRLARDAQQRPITRGFAGVTIEDHEGHGTQSCGVIAADPNDWQRTPDYPVNIHGVAPNAKLLPVRLSPHFSTQDVVDALTWCERQGARVINMSVTWSGTDLSLDWVLARALVSDMLVVASAGNAGQRRWKRNLVAYPSRHPAVLAVGASAKAAAPANEERIDYSQYGPLIDVVAPGELIATAKRRTAVDEKVPAGSPCTDGYRGTSAAAPVVAGLAALLRGAFPQLSAWEVRGVIEAGCEKIGADVGERYYSLPWRPKGPWSYRTGYGRVNAARSVTLSDVSIARIAPRRQPDGLLSPQEVIPGVGQFVNVAVHNAGPSMATNVSVSLSAVLGLSVEPRYPRDWTAVDAHHVPLSSPAPTIPSILAGDTQVVTFSIPPGLANDIAKHTADSTAALVSEAVCATDYPHVETNARSAFDSNNLAVHRLNEEYPMQPDYSSIVRSPSWRHLLIFAIGGLVGVLLILALLGGMLLLARHLAPANVCCHGGAAPDWPPTSPTAERDYPRPFPNPEPNMIIGQVGHGFAGVSCDPISSSTPKNGVTVELEEFDSVSNLWISAASPTTTTKKTWSGGWVNGYYEFDLSTYTAIAYRVVVPSGSFACDDQGSADGIVEFTHTSGGTPDLADIGLK